MKQFDDKQFIQSLNAVAATDDGRIVLAMLKLQCQWDMTILASDNPQATQYHATRRGVYGAIRQHIEPKHLKSIEFDYSKKVEKHDRDERIAKPSERIRNR